MSPDLDFLIRSAFERYEEQSAEHRIQLLKGLKEICPHRSELIEQAIGDIQQAERSQLQLLRLLDPND